MGEYTTVTIYKRLPDREHLSFLLTKFQRICWDLYDSKDDSAKTELIYREIGFVNPDGSIFDLNMSFLEDEGEVFQTNIGVLGLKDQLPNLTLSYKYSLPKFWLAILKPSELNMSPSGFIDAKLTGMDIITRVRDMYVENNNLSNHPIREFYVEEGEYTASIESLIDPADIVFISIGLIFYEEGSEYKDAARKEITNGRKEIASSIVIPHWRKTK